MDFKLWSSKTKFIVPYLTNLKNVFSIYTNTSREIWYESNTKQSSDLIKDKELKGEYASTVCEPPCWINTVQYFRVLIHSYYSIENIIILKIENKLNDLNNCVSNGVGTLENLFEVMWSSQIYFSVKKKIWFHTWDGQTLEAQQIYCETETRKFLITNYI